MVHQANQDLFQVWKEEVVFSWEWWFEAVLFLIPWVCWIRFRKKESTSRLLYAGFIVLIISSWLDFIGTTLGLWYYPVNIIPTAPAYLLWDFTLLPILAMLCLQIYPHVHPLYKACLYGGFNAFIGEPIFNWMGFYDPTKWKYIYSFPIFIVIYLIAYYGSNRESFNKL